MHMCKSREIYRSWCVLSAYMAHVFDYVFSRKDTYASESTALYMYVFLFFNLYKPLPLSLHGWPCFDSCMSSLCIVCVCVVETQPHNEVYLGVAIVFLHKQQASLLVKISCACMFIDVHVILSMHLQGLS